jgi:hypothetical protein
MISSWPRREKDKYTAHAANERALVPSSRSWWRPKSPAEKDQSRSCCETPPA